MQANEIMPRISAKRHRDRTYSIKGLYASDVIVIQTALKVLCDAAQDEQPKFAVHAADLAYAVRDAMDATSRLS